MPGRVVEHQQRPLTGQVIPPAGRPCVQSGRDLRPRQAGGQKQVGQRVRRISRPLSRCVTMQRHEVLPVSETRSELVSRMHRQRGLADPGHPANRDDLHHATSAGLRDVICQPRQLRSPARECRDITRQRPRRRRRESARQYRIVAASCGFIVRPAAGGGLEHSPLRPGQTKRVGQQPGGMAACRRADPAFQITDRPRTHPRRLSKAFLRQSRFSTQPPQQRPEARGQPLRHEPPPPSQTPAPRTSPVKTQPSRRAILRIQD